MYRDTKGTERGRFPGLSATAPILDAIAIFTPCGTSDAALKVIGWPEHPNRKNNPAAAWTPQCVLSL